MRSLLAAVLVHAAGAAAACPAADAPGLLFHSCHGSAARAEIRLMPEDGLPPVAAEGTAITLAAAYTAAGPRAGGLPLPVGLFVLRGRAVVTGLAPMDGLLVTGPRGVLALHGTSRVPAGDRVLDLREPADLRAFLADLATRGASALQGHLVIDGGRVATRPLARDDRHVRRMLFTDRDGYGIWQSPEPLTLHEATLALHAARAPDRALNLDMGTHDFCLADRGGQRRICGLVPPFLSGILSNLLTVSHR